ncbi:single-stranded-DNA-specific exonuclease RecJ [Eubacteriaceae bacterium ES2]|nr:single-stranded-DNA-specific exonuclease RecJ [Eubacteriaceae bacterium ES2]
MIKTKWIYRSSAEIEADESQERVKLFSDKLKIHPIVAEILVGRGFRSLDECRKFLAPELEDTHDPFLLPDIKKAVDRILKAQKDQEKIILYGDYDADGTIGVSVLYMFLQKIGCRVDYYIPNRLKTGYGLHLDPIGQLLADGMQLLITVDNGISSISEINALKNAGVDVIVTDHHECHGQLPQALAIINAKREDSQYPFKELCGAGVSLKLVQALISELGLQENIDEFFECVSLATVADIVTLKDENRLIVKKGLEYLNTQPRNLGLKKLIEVSELEQIKAWHFGFILGPKINAAGRLGEAHKIVDLLTTKDERQALALAEFLSEENKKRQNLEKDILEKAMQQIDENNLHEQDLILVSGDHWHSGVIGIVASRIQEKFYRPVVVIGVEDGVGKGSCRSIEGFNIFSALSSCGDIFLSFGGHAQAAGLSIAQNNIELLNQRLAEYALSVNLKSLLIAPVCYDLKLKSDDFSWEWFSELGDIEPTGIGNPGINFLISGEKISKFGRMGKEKDHLWVDFQGIRGVGFGMGKFHELLVSTSNYREINFIVKPSINEFNGTQSLQLQIKDIKRNPLENPLQARSILTAIVNDDIKNERHLIEEINGTSPCEMAVSISELRVIYRLLKRYDKNWINLSVFRNYDFSLFKIFFCIEVLIENELLTIEENADQIKMAFIQTNKKKDIQNSHLMIKLKKITS